MDEKKFVYACVYCPECGHVIPFVTVGANKEFRAYDPGQLRCRKDHVRSYRAGDVKVVSFEGVQKLGQG